MRQGRAPAVMTHPSCEVQVVVALMECLQEAGPVCAAASRVIEDLVSICKRHQPGKLRGIPPLPPLQELERANRVSNPCYHLSYISRPCGSCGVQQEW